MVEVTAILRCVCSGLPKLVRAGGAWAEMMFRCQKCGVTGKLCSSKRAAVESWNQRIKELRAQMAKKEAKSTDVAVTSGNAGVPAKAEPQKWGQGGFDPKDILLPGSC